jgi:hypothetical protein
VEERFGIDRAGWKALVEAIYPNAETADATNYSSCSLGRKPGGIFAFLAIRACASATALPRSRLRTLNLIGR